MPTLQASGPGQILDLWLHQYPPPKLDFRFEALALPRRARAGWLLRAGDLVGTHDFPNATLALAVFVVRPTVVRGLGIPPRS